MYFSILQYKILTSMLKKKKANPDCNSSHPENVAYLP